MRFYWIASSCFKTCARRMPVVLFRKLLSSACDCMLGLFMCVSTSFQAEQY